MLELSLSRGSLHISIANSRWYVLCIYITNNSSNYRGIWSHLFARPHLEPAFILTSIPVPSLFRPWIDNDLDFKIKIVSFPTCGVETGYIFGIFPLLFRSGRWVSNPYYPSMGHLHIQKKSLPEWETLLGAWWVSNPQHLPPQGSALPLSYRHHVILPSRTDEILPQAQHVAKRQRG